MSETIILSVKYNTFKFVNEFDLNDQSIMPDVIMAPLKELHIIK
jgi:hypothetical protein